MKTFIKHFAIFSFRECSSMNMIRNSFS